MMDKYKLVSVDEICTKITDGAHKTPKYTKEGIPFLSVKDISKGIIDLTNTRYVSTVTHNLLYKRCNPEFGDILYTKVGTTGIAKVVDIQKEFSLFVSVALLKPKHELINSRYFEYMLNTPNAYDQAQKRTRGVANRNLVLRDIKKIQIPLPPLPEQRRIVAQLDALFERIDKAIALLEENIEQTRALMDSVLGEVFEGVEKKNTVKKIGLLLQKTKNVNLKNSPEEQFKYIDISAIDKNQKQIVNPKTIIGREAPSRAKKLVRKGDLLFATTRPNLKNIAIVPNELDNSIASTGFCVLRTSNEIHTDYLFYYLISEKLQKQISPFIRGAQYPAISDKDLKNCTIPYTAKNNQVKIANFINVAFSKLTRIQKESESKLASLHSLKSSLLDRAFKGEL